MTSIEWTNETWNPIRARNKQTGGVGHFCEHVSDGCRNCYAERMQRRFKNPVRYAAQDRDKVELYLDEEVLLKPLRWRAPRKIFPCSMTDMFADFVPDEWLDRMFAVMAVCPHHIFQLLTKRPERMRAYFAGCGEPMGFIGENWTTLWPRRSGVQKAMGDIGRSGYFDRLGNVKTLPLPNVHLGTSVEDQRVDNRITDLIETPAAVRFISYEPALGPLELRPWLDGIDWVIIGGESGPGARPMDLAWVRSIVEQCKVADVPVFVKQLGPKPYEKRPAEGQEPGVDHALAHLGEPHPQRRWFPDWTLVHSGDESKWIRYWNFKDKKGGDITEFPPDLRVREFPA